ncbi:MAG: hypothetical protein SFX72_02785 [Isosphaeraceae bacterium]|nr:hypothetical protein [Isosphaeraceae bacterium]
MADDPGEAEWNSLGSSSEGELKELLGLFDVPAFARRGQDLEFALARLDRSCRAARDERLEMVRTRLRQWAAAASGPDDWSTVFENPIDALWELADAPRPDRWAAAPARGKRLLVVAGDLITSAQRFNRRWLEYLEKLPVDGLNRMIDHFNRYYLLEKECSLGSARLAARHFQPQPRIDVDRLIARYPLLPVPRLCAKG